MQELDYAGIGMRIRKARKEKGMSQDELAKECGICISFMGHIERGTRRMSLETFANICMILESDAGELLMGTPKLSDHTLEMVWNKNARKKESYEMYVSIMKSVAEIMGRA